MERSLWDAVIKKDDPMNNYSGQNQNAPSFNGLSPLRPHQGQTSAVYKASSVAEWVTSADPHSAVETAGVIPNPSVSQSSSNWDISQQSNKSNWSNIESRSTEENLANLNRQTLASSESASELITGQPLDGDMTYKTGNWPEAGQQYLASSENASELVTQQPSDSGVPNGTGNWTEVAPQYSANSESTSELVTQQLSDSSMTCKTGNCVEVEPQYSANSESASELVTQQPSDSGVPNGTGNWTEARQQELARIGDLEANDKRLEQQIDSLNSSLQPLRERIEEVSECAENISDELGAAYNDFNNFNTEIEELKKRNKSQDRDIDELSRKISQIDSDRQQMRLEIEALTRKFNRVDLLWEQLDKLSGRLTELEQLQTFAALKDLKLDNLANNHTEAGPASLDSLKSLECYSLEGIERGIDSFPEDIQKLFYQVKRELEEVEAQNRECDKLLAVLRRRLIPDSLVSGEKLVREKVPELFLTLCKFAIRTNQRPLLDWLTSRGFEGFAAVGLKLINPTSGDNFDKSTCIPISTSVAPSTDMRGKVAACLCPGLVLIYGKNDGSSSEYCYAPAEISLYT